MNEVLDVAGLINVSSLRLKRSVMVSLCLFRLSKGLMLDFQLEITATGRENVTKFINK